MEGIEILSQSEVVAATTSNTDAAVLTFVLVLAVMIGIGVIAAYKTEEISWFLLCFVLGLVFGVGIGITVEQHTTYTTAYETHYKVTIDDSVSMNEFLDKYEILDQEGKIYTVKERNPNG